MPDADPAPSTLTDVTRRAATEGVWQRLDSRHVSIDGRAADRESRWCLTPASLGIGVRHVPVRESHHRHRGRHGADGEMPDTSGSARA
jgi:hypothetical protein